MDSSATIKIIEWINSELSSFTNWASRLLIDMISIPTVSPKGEGYKEFVDFITDRLREFNANVQVINVPQELVDRELPKEAKGKPRYIILTRIGRKGPILHFNAHYDVVPGGPGWTVTEPFKPIVKNGKVYGRGATDMKGGLTSMLLAQAILSHYTKELPFRIEVALVPDEEIGGKTGTGYLVNFIKPDFVIIGEPSSLKNVWIGHKGAVWAKVKVYGKIAHGSTPWLGINAFELLVKVASITIEELKPKIESRRSAYTYDIEYGERATIMIGGRAEAGEKINQVPGEAYFTIDRRVIPEEDLDFAVNEIIEFYNDLSKRLKSRIDVEIVNKIPAAITEPDNVLVKSLQKTVSLIQGFKPKLTVCMGGLDLHYYTRKFNIPAIAYGPGIASVSHGPDEYVVLDDVFNVAKIYALLGFIITEMVQ